MLGMVGGLGEGRDPTGRVKKGKTPHRGGLIKGTDPTGRFRGRERPLTSERDLGGLWQGDLECQGPAVSKSPQPLFLFSFALELSDFLALDGRTASMSFEFWEKTQQRLHCTFPSLLTGKGWLFSETCLRDKLKMPHCKADRKHKGT